MTLLFADSFDHYNTSQLGRKWDDVHNTVAINAGVGRNSSPGLQTTSSGGTNGWVTKSLSVSAATLIVGAAFNFSASVATQRFVWLTDGTVGPTVQFMLQRNADGSINAYRGDSGTLLGTTAPGVLSSTAVHYYVELKVLIHPSAGTVDLRVNGASVLSLTGQNTRQSANSFATQVSFGNRDTTGISVNVDDVYICDNSGSTNNTFLGDVRVECLFPNGAGSTTNFAPSAGSNYQCVDDNPANDDTDYVSSSTVTDRDLYAMASLSSTSGAVKAVCVTTTDRKDDSGTRTHAHVVKSGASVSVGTAFAPTTAYAIHQTVFESKPGGGAWTISDVNGAEAGLEIST